MVERSENRKSLLVGPVVPVPVAPVWTWYDWWDVSTVSTKAWSWYVPKDGMLYKLTNYSHTTLPNGFLASAVYKNGELIFYMYNGYEVSWTPGAERAPSFKYPDYISVILMHFYTSTWYHYWSMSFWREQEQ